eukprot:11354958-Alexandrium_andersonii.AAC.1
MPRRGASPLPRAPFRALWGPPPDGCSSMGEDAFTQHLGAPRSGASSCPVRARSPTARRPSGSGAGSAL